RHVGRHDRHRRPADPEALPGARERRPPGRLAGSDKGLQLTQPQAAVDPANAVAFSPSTAKPDMPTRSEIRQDDDAREAPPEAVARVKELRDEIERHNYAYYVLDEPL